MLVITGANGHLGRRLINALGGQIPVRALVRSEQAALQIRQLSLDVPPEVQLVDYLNPHSMRAALDGSTAVVHLVGIIRETADNRYQQAHEESCRVLAEAADSAGAERIVYLSILGAAPDARNACLASRGRAEALLCRGRVPALILRVPMVLGEDDFASRALARRARRGVNLVLRGSSLEQPIYAGDVVRAMKAGLELPLDGARTLDLAGPESLSRTELTRRAAAVAGRRTRVVSLPLFPAMGVARVLELVSRRPPVTRAMLGVLDHDDRIDPSPAAEALGIALTPLPETLRRCLG
jgi:NADH dehydrogenase